jgi:hypothetical protein
MQKIGFIRRKRSRSCGENFPRHRSVPNGISDSNVFGREKPPEANCILDALREFLSSHKEDLLTADVFGALKYLPRRPYLEALF